MFHSVTINGKNTWDDYHMVPADGIYLPAPPQQKRNTIDLKTANGILDISTILTGYPIFQNRSGEMKYWILEPWDYDSYAEIGSTQNPLDFPSAYDMYSRILGDIHGSTGTMIFEDDPGWFWKGYFEVKSFSTEEIRRGVSISYDVAPYKYSVEEFTTEQVGLGDSIWNYTSDMDFDILGNMPINPEVTIEGTFTSGQTCQVRILKNDGSTITKTITGAGTYSWGDFLIYREGKLCFKAESNLSATWRFRQGRL